ncbi:helix-turn-helix domain-containing protein [Treponema sp.]|uniref:helix-turn-helix domain-containing protein n=1 Tax=Treponema sp. TaxID=166 RepID=UPI0025E81F57|nr:helix-turn-helix transcriptional regulator [Treponema sp.]MBR4322536.1 helix-turn-helix transcriptional regulator [Treponema sp.]
MTHLQELFINNIRFYRTKANFTQIDFAAEIEVSPNYLNAVENGKYFPSPDVLQRMCDSLELSPYQLFLEQPEISNLQNKAEYQQTIMSLKQEIDALLQKYLIK